MEHLEGGLRLFKVCPGNKAKSILIETSDLLSGVSL